MASPDAVHTVAVIPARGGSKGVPHKNLRPVGGVPLVVRTVRTALRAAEVGLVVVSTDDPGIGALARSAGARVVDRPAELAGDTTTSESALLHALDVLADDGLAPEITVFLQCTSPFLDPSTIDAGVGLLRAGRADTAFSALPTYEFLWRDHRPADGEGAVLVAGQNHDPAHRPRRQDREPDHRETGAMYAMRTDGFRAARHRFFGRTAAVAVAEHEAIEIDTVAELEVADALARVLDTATGPSADAGTAGWPVDAVVTDFDGVHTPDTCYLDAHGTESVRVSRRDGMGVARLRRAGVPMLIVSTETDPVVTRRAEKLQVPVRQAVEDKATAVLDWCRDLGLDPGRVAFVGNDVNDLAAMAVVGWPVATADADPAVLRAARYVLRRRGGDGAVREACDLVLAARAREESAPAPEPVSVST